MRYTYLSSFENFKLAQRCYRRSSARRQFAYMVYTIILPLICAVSSILIILHASQVDTEWNAAPFAGFLLLFAILQPLLRARTMRRAYKAWSAEHEGKLVFIEIDKETLISGHEGRSEGRFLRPAICNVAEDDNILLLFVNKKKFLYLPKKLLPPAAIEEVRAWLALPGAPPSC